MLKKRGVATEEVLLSPLEETLVMDKNLVEEVFEPEQVENEETSQEETPILARSFKKRDEPRRKTVGHLVSSFSDCCLDYWG